MPRITRTIQYAGELIIWRQLTPTTYTVETYEAGRIVGCDVRSGRAPIGKKSFDALT